jgi:radical SAM-linked protein
LIEKKEMLSRPELPNPKVVRLKFCKVGTLQYISHLDLQRTFNRILVRACIPVWYTQGFNPHIKLVFSTPLSVGSESVCEYLDIRLSREMPLDELKDRLNAEMTDEFYITEVYEPKNDFSSIAYASYDIAIHTNGASESLARKIEEILSTSPLTMIKKGKAGEKEIDIIPLIKEVKSKYNEENQNIELNVVLSASSTQYLNPEMLITALKEKTDILSGSLTEEYYSILRTTLRKEDMSEFF